MLDEPFDLMWAEPAVSALDDAYQYIAQENPAAADDFITEVHSRLAQLTTLPELGFKTKVRG
jgi:plasmid stabilization system protein ParE